MAFKIVDSTGKEVGKFISLFGADSSLISALVQMKINNKLYTIEVYPDRIGNEGGSLLYHTSSDCTGQEYISYEPNTDLFSRYVLTSLGWITHAPEGITPQTITIGSYGETTSASCAVQSGTITAVTLQQATGPDFRAGFTPPFKID